MGEKYTTVARRGAARRTRGLRGSVRGEGRQARDGGRARLGSGQGVSQGRGAGPAWPGTAKGKTSRGPEDRSRDQRGAATAHDQWSSVVPACREEQKKQEDRPKKENRRTRHSKRKNRGGVRGGDSQRGGHRRRTQNKQKTSNTKREERKSKGTDTSNLCKRH